MAQLKGKLLHKTATESKTSAKDTQYQERVIYVAPYTYDRDTGVPTTTPDNVVKLKLFGDRCTLVDNIAVGTDVTISYALSGRKVVSPQGQSDVYNDITVFSVIAPVQPMPTSQPMTQQAAPTPQPRPEIHREPAAAYTPQPQPAPTADVDPLPF